MPIDVDASPEVLVAQLRDASLRLREAMDRRDTAEVALRAAEREHGDSQMALGRARDAYRSTCAEVSYSLGVAVSP